jgi:CO/xanthine dehydrogenase FAD-binding subunit
MSLANDAYLRPPSLLEALAALAAGECCIVSGGTDIFPAHVGKPLPPVLLDISAIEGLRGIARGAGGYRLGALTTWSDIIRAELPPAFDGLKQAARQVGSVQVQNRGTIAGNLCNASPAADGVPPLLALDAEVELTSIAGTRTLPLAEFITGYRQTSRQPSELLTAVVVPEPPANAKSAFVKLGARKYLVISIVMAAAVVARDEAGVITTARVAVGAASETAKRLGRLEADLKGLPPGTKPSTILRAEHFAPLQPISDVRATSAYRRDAAWALVAEALDGAA